MPVRSLVWLSRAEAASGAAKSVESGFTNGESRVDDRDMLSLQRLPCHLVESQWEAQQSAVREVLREAAQGCHVYSLDSSLRTLSRLANCDIADYCSRLRSVYEDRESSHCLVPESSVHETASG